MTRTLYVGLDHRYICRTVHALPRIIEQASAEFDAFGPGYNGINNEERLAEKIYKFAPDVIVCSDFFLIYGDQLRQRSYGASIGLFLYRLRRFTNYKFTDKELGIWISCVETLLEKNYKPKLVVTALETDWYKLNEAEIQLLRSADYIAGYGSEFMARIEDLPDLASEKWGMEANNNMLTLMQEMKSKTICLLDFAQNETFCRRAHSLRGSEWCIPGVKYNSRRIATEKIRKQKCRYKHKRSLISRILFMPLLPRCIRGYGLDLYNKSFDNTIQGSKYAYTCGSALRYPVTKMFEIPSAKTLLVCDPFINCENAGYRHMENYISSNSEAINYWIDWCRQNWERAEEIATRGYQLVLESHSETARVNQLRMCLDAIAEGVFCGSSWKNGTYILYSHQSDNEHG